MRKTSERERDRRHGRITRAVPSVVRSLLYRFLKVPSSLRPSRRAASLRLARARPPPPPRTRGARASLDRRPPGAAGAVAGLGLRERAAQSNLNRRARPTRGHRRSLSLPPVSRDTRDTRGASCVYAACDTRDHPITRRRRHRRRRRRRRRRFCTETIARATISAREEAVSSRARARERGR